MANTTLCEMLRFAYYLVSDDQVASPNRIKDREARFDLVAKGPVGATREQLLEMLQTLLDERFKITKHNERRVVAHYELAIATGGLEIHPSKPEAKGHSIAAGTAAPGNRQRIGRHRSDTAFGARPTPQMRPIDSFL